LYIRRCFIKYLLINYAKMPSSKKFHRWKLYYKESINNDSNNGRTFYISRNTSRETNFYFTIFHASNNLRWYYIQSGSELLWTYVTSKFRRRSRKIDSRQEVWREQTFFPTALTTFAINRVCRGYSRYFLDRDLAILPPFLTFQTLSFSGTPRYLTSRSLSVAVCTATINLQAQRIATGPCESRKIAIAVWHEPLRREETFHRSLVGGERVTICTSSRKCWKRRETIGTPVESSIAPPLANARNCVNGIELPSIAKTGNSRARFDLLNDCWWIPAEWLSFCG